MMAGANSPSNVTMENIFLHRKQTAITDKGQEHAANWTNMWNTLQARPTISQN